MRASLTRRRSGFFRAGTGTGTRTLSLTVHGPSAPLHQPDADSRVGENQADDAASLSDAELQAALDHAALALATVPTVQERRSAWDRLVELKKIERERAQRP